MPTHYEVLGVSELASVKAIKKAYIKLALINHPDKTRYLPLHERKRREHVFKLVNSAYEHLSEPAKRRAYDRQLQRSPFSANEPPQWGFKADAFYSPSLQPEHRFSSRGAQTAPSNGAWFDAAINETAKRTNLLFSNNANWKFGIGVSDRFELVAKPKLPSLDDNTFEYITIVFFLRQNKSAFLPNGPTKDLLINMEKTPKMREVCMSSILKKDADGCIELKITLSAHLPAATSTRSKLMWTFSFDVDHSYKIQFYAKFKATNIMFYPYYPHHVFNSNDEYPAGSPMLQLKQEHEEFRFLNLSRPNYYQKSEWERKTFHQLKAVAWSDSLPEGFCSEM